jgi:hypothetical protein
MTVAELINKLSEFPDNMEVRYLDDEFGYCHITDVYSTKEEMHWGPDSKLIVLIR